MSTITQFCKRLLDIVLPKPPIEQISLESFLEKTKFDKNPYPIKDKMWILAPLKYKNPLVREAIHALKYKNSQRSAELLAETLHPFLLEYISDIQTFGGQKKFFLVPIPLSSERLRERGYNQAYVLSKNLEKMFENEICTVLDSVLIRNRNTKPQTKTSSRKERLKNVIGCFEVKNPTPIKGKNIILVDDVVTTGATVSEAQKILIRSGSNDVLALAVAH